MYFWGEMAKKKPYNFEDATETLTDRQMLFCMEYINCRFNGTEAAKKAGYSENTANEQAARLLANVSIQKFIQELKNDLGKRVGITAEMIAVEMGKVAFSNIGNMMTVDGGIKQIAVMDEKDSAVISSLEVFEEKARDTGDVIGFTKKLKLYDKLKALSDLNVMLGYNKPMKVAGTDKNGDDVEPKQELGPAGVALVLEELRKRGT